MKILQDKFPKGSLPGQHTDGRYIDESYYENLKVLAEVITDDMTFMAIVSSSTLEVGTGKSVFIQQTAEAWIHLVNTIHKFNLPDLSMKNIVFKPEDLIKKAFDVPKYSVILLDEWEDAHYWSRLGISLRQFFRKCRQLNLFMMIVCPNFFQLPSSYAISRSVFFVDVRFEGKFERGYFRFFSFKKKKELYNIGKKTQNYDCVQPDFIGRFTKGYVVNEDEYRRAKYKDMIDSEEDTRIPTEREIKLKLFKEFRQNNPDITMEQLTKGFGIGMRTGYNWLEDVKNFEDNLRNNENAIPPQYTNIIKQQDDNPQPETEET